MFTSSVLFNYRVTIIGILFAGGNVAWQVSIMFATLEKIAQTDPKYADIFLLENYAAFQNRQVFPLPSAKKKLFQFYGPTLLVKLIL